MFRRFCNMFSESSPGRWAVLQLLCWPSKQGELSETMLQNLWNKFSLISLPEVEVKIISASTGAFGVGCVLGWPSPVLPYISGCEKGGGLDHHLWFTVWIGWMSHWKWTNGLHYSIFCVKPSAATLYTLWIKRM